MPKKIVVKKAYMQTRETRAFMKALNEEAEARGFSSYADLVRYAIDWTFPGVRKRMEKNLKQEQKDGKL